jgi:hypothetical protein
MPFAVEEPPITSLKKTKRLIACSALLLEGRRGQVCVLAFGFFAHMQDFFCNRYLQYWPKPFLHILWSFWLTFDSVFHTFNSPKSEFLFLVRKRKL